MENCCDIKTKKEPRNDNEINNLINRLNRISGQIDGVKSMIEKNRYCGDVLIQISAIESAIKEVGYIILNEHLHSCVKDDILNGNEDSLAEVMNLIKRLK